MILFQYLTWQFWDMPKRILGAIKNCFFFGIRYFSVDYLIKTIFSPWKKYCWYYEKGFDIKKYLEVFSSNAVSRIIGFCLKVFLIFVWILFELMVLIAGVLLFIFWIFLPIMAIAGMIYSLRYFNVYV